MKNKINNQLSNIKCIKTSKGNIYLTDYENEKLKLFLSELLNKRLKIKYKINKDLKIFIY